jgi:hypothetical protein
VRQELRAIAGELADQVEVAREQATMSFEDFENALMWEAEVRKVAYLLDTERALLETPGRHLMRQLHELFGRICPANQPLPADGLALRHRRYADILRQKVAFLARTETLPTIFNAVKARLEAGAQKERLKNVALPGHASPAAALEALRAEAAQARAWYEDDFQSFEDDDLFLDGHDDGAARDFSADEYRKVMQQKIDAVVHRAVHLMGCRVKRHLKKLEDELSWLGNGKAGVDTSSDTETFDTLIRALREVSYAP